MSDVLHHPPNEPANDPTVDSMAGSEALHIDRYEGIWVRISMTMLAVFTIAVIYASTAMGIHLPGMHMRLDPRVVATPGMSLFAEPKLTQIGDGDYEVYIRAQAQPWIFTPSEIHIPVGAKLTLYITSQDVQHGFHIDKTNVNVMVLPGQVTKTAARFDKPGVYNFVCHEYCGIGHHTMFGRIIVESPEMIAAATATAEAEVVSATGMGNAQNGQANFALCAGCHGAGGEGVKGLGKPLANSEFTASLTDTELVDFIKRGRAIDDPANTSGVAMPPKGGNPALSDTDLLDIVAFIRTLQTQ
jgi:cytochrome c oxidase subunit II